MSDINKETVIKAKKKLKAHLDRYKHEEDFMVTDRKVLYWFGVINRAMFKNELIKPMFILKKIKSNWGECNHNPETREITINIDTSIDSRDLFLATLAHEMVHMWQQQFEDRQSHTDSYLKWKRIFKKKFNITL